MATEREVVIGLGIHAQLATKSKIFSAASTAFGAAPNTQACLVDLGYPGVLPVLNEEAVRMALGHLPGVVVHEEAPHGHGRHGEEVAAVLPVGPAVGVY